MLRAAEGRVVFRETDGLRAAAEDGAGAADVRCVKVHPVTVLANETRSYGGAPVDSD